MRYKTARADLWGNRYEGYEVNDWYPKETIEIDDHEFEEKDSEILKNLIAIGYFSPDALHTDYEFEDMDESGFYIRFNLNVGKGEIDQELFKFWKE